MGYAGEVRRNSEADCSTARVRLEYEEDRACTDASNKEFSGDPADSDTQSDLTMEQPTNKQIYVDLIKMRKELDHLTDRFNSFVGKTDSSDYRATNARLVSENQQLKDRITALEKERDVERATKRLRSG